MADNGLSSISPRRGQLKRLRMLDLGHNALFALDKIDLRWIPSLAPPDWLARMAAADA